MEQDQDKEVQNQVNLKAETKKEVVKMIFSSVCVNEKFGFVKMQDGTLKPNRLGRYVYTIEELEAMGK